MGGVLRQWSGTEWVDLLGDVVMGAHDHVASHSHVQSAPSSVWDLTYDLPFVPNVMVVDSAGTVVVGHVELLGPGSIRLTFSGPFSGTAYLS